MADSRTVILFLGVVLLCGAGALATIAPDDWFHPSIHSDTSSVVHESQQQQQQPQAPQAPQQHEHNTPNMTRSTETATDPTPRVALDFYVMSKCPDAEVCLTQFQPAVTTISSIADVSVNYIASWDGAKFTCMHGPSECDGNVQQVCAESLFPNVTSTGSLPWFDFMACQEQTRSNIPNNGESCAQLLGLDWNELNSCATGSQGTKLLISSIAATNAAQQTVSCTININKNFWCQHNGAWVNCSEGNSVDDLIHAICKRYTGTDKPPACTQ